MHKHTHNLTGCDEKGPIFGLVFGVISIFGLGLGLILGFGSDFGSIFGLIFGFGLILGVISLLMLMERHYKPELRNAPDDFAILPADFV